MKQRSFACLAYENKKITTKRELLNQEFLKGILTKQVSHKSNPIRHGPALSHAFQTLW